MMALTAKNKFAFVDGSLQKPSEESEVLFHAWTRSNNMVLSWLLNSISKEIASSVIYINSAHEMWNDLKDRFSQKNGPRIFQLQKTISAHSQGSMTVSNYYTRLKGLWDEFTNYRPIPECSCGALKTTLDHYHQDYIFQFLMGLNDSFAQIRGQILLIDPLPSINKVFSLVLQEERQREISIDSLNNETAAMMIKNPLPRYGSQSQQNRFVKQPFLHNSRNNRPICTHCGLLGHTMEKCYKLHGYPPGYRANKNKVNSVFQSQESDYQNNQVPQLSIFQEQCQQLLALIKPPTSPVKNSASVHQVSNAQDHLFSNMGDFVTMEDDWHG